MLTLNRKAYSAHLLLALAVTVLFLIPDQLQQSLVYQQEAIRQGEWWRLVSGHLLHSNATHLVMNLAGLLVLMFLHGPITGRLANHWQLLSLLLLTGISIWFLAPDLDNYVGLSGMLHGLLCYGAVADLRQGYRSGALILLGVAAKLAVEQYQGPDPALAAQIGAEVAIDAHLLGALCGVLLALLSWRQIKHQ